MSTTPPSNVTGDTAAERLFSGPGEMSARCRALDWAATPLGAVDRWPAALGAAVRLGLDSVLATCVYAGPEHVLVYNDGFVRALGDSQHPTALGRSAREVWPEFREQLAPRLARVLAGGPAVCHDRQRLFVDRDGRRQETYWSCTLSPVRAEDGSVVGVQSVVIETTAQIRGEAMLRQSEERQAFLLRLSDVLRPLTVPGAIQAEAARVLGEHLAANRAFYAEVEGDDWVVASAYERGVKPQARGRHPMASFGPWILDLFGAGEDLVIRDLDADARFDPSQRAAHEAYGIVGAVAVPLVKEGTLVAILVVHSAAPRDWSEAEIALVDETAERTWAAVERARAEAGRRESEARARALVENLPGGAVFVLDHDLRYLLAAGEAFRAASFTAEAFVGRTLGEVLEPALVETYIPHYRQALGGESFEVEHTSHGRTFLTRGTPLRDEADRVVAALAVSIDITERRRAEAGQRASEARYRMLVENVRDYAIFMLDPSGLITEWTRGAERVKGYVASEVVGRSVALFYTPEELARGELAIELAEAAGTGRAEREGWRVCKGGGRIWVNEVATAVRDAAGELHGFTKISRDLTAHKHLDEERERVLAREQEARREAERAMVLRDEFLATISHELRTPLSSILLWSRMLTAGAVPPAQQPKALASIEASASAQKQLIEDLLDLSRMVAGTLRIEPCEVDLRSVVSAAVDTVQAMPRAKNVRLTAHWGEDRPVLVHGDAARLQQVVWNLLTNAVKFTPRGGAVELRVETAPRVARVIVRDTGRGIDPSFLPHVFDRFRQSESDAARSTTGLGLGLSIVRELVALHGGRVEASSEGEGRGATFTIELPRLSRPSSIPPASRPPRPGPGPSARPLDGVRVLLVEDNAETQQALSWLLEASGAEVTSASSAAAALTSLAGRWPDVLVSDIGLPGEDGYALMGRVRAHAQAQGRPVPPALALTAYARGEDRDRALSEGFMAYASKPIEPKPLLDAVAALARASR